MTGASALAGLRLFALGSSRAFGVRVADSLGVLLAEHHERNFDDGEHETRPLASVRGKDVFVIHSLYAEPEASVNDKLCRLFFFIGALTDAGADRVSAVVPYLCYARKDRRTKPRDPVTTRYVAALFEAAGADRLLALEVHDLAAFQNAYRIGTDHLESRRLFVDHFTPLLEGTEVVVASPDLGGIKRATAFGEMLAAALGRPVERAFMEKRRSRGVVSGGALVGEVRDRTVILFDDLIATGATIAGAARACRERGAARVFAAATHGLFLEGAEEVVRDPALERVIVTDTVPPFRLPTDLVRDKLRVLEVASLFADAIQRTHTGESVAKLLEL